MFIRGALKEFYAKVFLGDNITQVDPDTLGTSANTVIWNPGADDTDTYMVEYKLVNKHASNSSGVIHVGLDVNASGSITHYWWRETLLPQMRSGWEGPFVITGGDDVMAWCATGSTVDINFRIRKVVR